VARDDWFRGPEWDAATQKRFEEKLSRARTQRAQYLRIKGYELTQADDRRVWEAGRQLLFRVLNEHPDDRFFVVDAHDDLGRSFAREGQFEKAAAHYEKSLELQKISGPDPGTRLALAELIVEADWRDRYQQAADLLSEYVESRGLMFPADRFRVLLAEARMAQRLGQTDVARRDAEAALELLTHNKSPLPRHPDVGLIELDPATFRELETLASI
jgi:tetratricopeptide (TPR) repeat protein